MILRITNLNHRSAVPGVVAPGLGGVIYEALPGRGLSSAVPPDTLPGVIIP